MFSIQKLERLCKIIFVFMFSFYMSIVALNNILDFNSNYEFIKHVLLMDTTFKNNQLLARSISSTEIHSIFYVSLITYEILTAMFGWLGTFIMLKNFNKSIKLFHNSKKFALIGLMLNLIMWFFAFNTIGGEWFLMWQSPQWNGVTVARSMFVVIFIIFIYVLKKEEEIS